MSMNAILHSSTSLHPCIENVLVVDLDGTLLRSDLLDESLFAFFRQAPARIPISLVWLLKGKANFKRELAKHSELDVSVLPYNEDLIRWLREERAKGRTLILATGADEILATKVADYFGIFDAVLASDGLTNLTASAKLRKIAAHLGSKTFCYIGNSSADLKVWAGADSAVVVDCSPRFVKSVRAIASVERVFPGLDLPARMMCWAKALRVHQWLKNLLIFLPFVAAHKLHEPTVWLAAAIAFLAFGLTASSVYLLNDLLDLADDRHHRSKRSRPFASGEIPLRQGLVAVGLLLLGSTALLYLLPWEFAVTLGAYYGLTTVYSFGLKRVVLVDVMSLACLYTVRLIAGAAAVGVAVSFWLLAFSMFIFLSLALLKRYSELVEMRRVGKLSARGRGYHVDDLGLLVSLGCAAGYGSVLVLALYVNSDAVMALYAEPRAIWLACPLLLYWISRAWIVAHRGEMHDDPVIYAVRDRTSRWVGGLMAAIFWLAI